MAFSSACPPLREAVCSCALYSLGVACLLISPIPTYSLKKISFRVQRLAIAPLLVGIALAASIFFNFSWMSVLFACALYLARLPISAFSYKRLSQEEGSR